MEQTNSCQRGGRRRDWIKEGEGIISQRTYIRHPWTQTTVWWWLEQGWWLGGGGQREEKWETPVIVSRMKKITTVNTHTHKINNACPECHLSEMLCSEVSHGLSLSSCPPASYWNVNFSVRATFLPLFWNSSHLRLYTLPPPLALLYSVSNYYHLPYFTCLMYYLSH